MVASPPMRLCTFDAGAGARPGVVDGDEIADLSEAFATTEALIEAGPSGIERAREVARAAPRVSLEPARLLPPLRPASLRDFLAFEDHARGGAIRRGEELNPTWFRFPVYYKGNHRQIVGPDEDLRWPPFTEQLDFELELACVLGPERTIFGYTVMNDWSARDLQREEMGMRLGPAKSKDFATSLGPWIVTADEVDPTTGLRMTARVNGETWCDASTASMHWTFGEMIAWVGECEEVCAGDVYGSGTPFGGCGLDLDRWIAPDDVVELEVEGIGVLRNRVVRRK
jgi:2-keto-4-pentenoate hydratase/2-oxohepta-3-ene-1,7-dioic acid hydratase in catechol pathway